MDAAQDLRHLSLAMHLYAVDNSDRLPTRLSDLAPYLPSTVAGSNTMNTFDKYNDNRSKDQIDAKSSYVYVSGRNLQDVADTIVMYEKTPVDGMRWVLQLYRDPVRMPEKVFRMHMQLDGSPIVEVEEERPEKEQGFLYLP
jgi:hypothetical protein